MHFQFVSTFQRAPKKRYDAVRPAQPAEIQIPHLQPTANAIKVPRRKGYNIAARMAPSPSSGPAATTLGATLPAADGVAEDEVVGSMPELVDGPRVMTVVLVTTPPPTLVPVAVTTRVEPPVPGIFVRV